MILLLWFWPTKIFLSEFQRLSFHSFSFNLVLIFFLNITFNSHFQFERCFTCSNCFFFLFHFIFPFISKENLWKADWAFDSNQNQTVMCPPTNYSLCFCFRWTIFSRTKEDLMSKLVFLLWYSFIVPILKIIFIILFKHKFSHAKTLLRCLLVEWWKFALRLKWIVFYSWLSCQAFIISDSDKCSNQPIFNNLPAHNFTTLNYSISIS